MYNIEIDFEVFKELTYRRQSESEDCNDVIRRLLELGIRKSGNSAPGKSWSSEGLDFPHGTEFRATYKGKSYTARIENGELLAEGKPARSLSHAVKVVTGTGRNGWTFWESRRPGEPNFKLANDLRKKAA